ncbi:hypothetical protein CRE_13928 [Caenorhabditis remanei]|uniref:Uncharacterized protein n=1 Tax=Caenorhabditis remanei TaxID=31234 RepID=E3M8S8_CAERE|nr:hypothetical protein CRE_13928 [Caenorhabditis remanei]
MSYKTCQEAADFHYRRCLTDRFYEMNLTYAFLAEFCKNLVTTTPGPSTTIAPSTTTNPDDIKKFLSKTSNLITVGAICGIIFLFVIGVAIFCCIRKRRQRKKEEAEGWGIPGWSSSSTTSGSSTKSDVESSAWDFGLTDNTSNAKTAKEKTNMLTALGGGGTAEKSKKLKKSKKSEKKKKEKKPAPADPPVVTPTTTPATPATTPTAHTPTTPAPASAPKSGFAGFPALFGGAAKKSQMAAPKPVENEKHESTGNTATMRPLVWNKQAAENVYY